MAFQSKADQTESTNTSENEEKAKKITFASLESKHKVTDPKEVLKHATKLVRCIITCNNTVKASLPGEIFSVRNSLIPEQKKFISFNTPTHVPQMMLNMIKEKKYQHFTKKRLPNGQFTTEAKLLPEYNVQELPPLTEDEYMAIRQKQLAEGNA